MHEATIEFHKGQLVPFPHAPDGTAQVDGLLRRNVELLYVCRGRLCRRRVAATALAGFIERSPLLPGLPQNPLRRAVLKQSKRFPLTRLEVGHAHNV